MRCFLKYFLTSQPVQNELESLDLLLAETIQFLKSKWLDSHTGIVATCNDGAKS